MKIYAPVTEAVLDALKTIVGAEYVLTEPEKLEQYQTDEETDPRKFHLPEAVVLPKDAQEIAAVIKLANTYDVPVTVRSGGTSLAGGVGSVAGAVMGAFIMASLDNGMSMMDVPTFWQYIVKGAILLLAVWMDSATKRRS